MRLVWTLALCACSSAAPLDGAVPPACDVPAGGDADGTSTMHFESLDPPAHVVMSRYRVMWGPGESVTFGALRLGVSAGGDSLCSLDASEIAYVNSHHNFADRVTLTRGGRRYELSMALDAAFAWADTLSVLDATTGTLLVGPIALTKTGGPSRGFGE